MFLCYQKSITSTGIERVQQQLHNVMAEKGQDPRVQLLESTSLHYDRVLKEEDAYFFEAAAFWGRNPEFREVRDRWYQSLDRHYAGLIKKIHPEWDKPRCSAASFQVLTLILGAWVTMGSSRPLQRRRSRTSLNQMLLSGIEHLIG